MSLLNYLKEKKIELLNAKDSNEKYTETCNMNNIEIIIENSHNLFQNEEETIKTGARSLLENGSVDSLEEGIIVIATMMRGLKYKTTEKDNRGNIKIILQDIELEKSNAKRI